MNAITILWLLANLMGQTAQGDSADDAAARLAAMKKFVQDYSVRSNGPSLTMYTLQPDPVLRFTNTVGSSRDGAVFLWLGENGRPAVAAQVALRRDDVWYQEFSSLSEQSLTASHHQRPWTPRRGGIEFKTLSGAPRPGETPETRMRQMRALAAEFTVEDHFRGRVWQPLRPLSKQFARYGKPGTDVIDGALFGFVLTTDPEALLLIESNRGSEAAEWRFAFAPMTQYAVRASWRGQEVWNLPRRTTQGMAADPGEPFYVTIIEPEP